MKYEDIINTLKDQDPIFEKVMKEAEGTFCVDEKYLSTANTCTSTSANLTIESFKEQIEILLANQTKYEPNVHVAQGTVVVVDHEKIRKEMIPWSEQRGKTLLYNPNDEAMIQKIKDYIRKDDVK